MRVNASKALAAFVAGKRAVPAESVWTDGETIYSYRTAIATRTPAGFIVLNRTKYSQTTTVHQNAFAYHLTRYFSHVAEVDGLRQGVEPRELIAAASSLEVVAEWAASQPAAI